MFLNEPNKYVEVLLNNNFSKYDDVSVFVKNNLSDEYVTNKNEKYKILSIRAQIFYEDDFDNCIIERDKIVEIFSKILPSAKKSESYHIHGADPSGESIIDSVYLDKSYERSKYTCTDWGESISSMNNWVDHLSIYLDTEEIIKWFEN